MHQPISLQDTGQHFLISIDKSVFDQQVVFQILNRLRIEYLVKKADFSKDIEQLGDEFTDGWWKANKDAIISSAK